MQIEQVVCKDLVKVYKKKKRLSLLPPRSEVTEIHALDGLSFTIYEGEIFGLLGPNGAGKTTTIQIIAGLLLPDSGEVEVAGVDAIRNPNLVKRIVGVVSGGNPRQLYNKLTAYENLEYFGRLYGIPDKELKSRILELLELVKLADRSDEEIEKFSAGMKQRLLIARGLLHDPDVLLLDEPTVGLDPKSSRDLRKLIRDEIGKREGKAILLTTHEMNVAEELSDRIAIINRGRLVALDTPSGLKQNFKLGRLIEIIVETDDGIPVSQMQNISGVRSISVTSIENSINRKRVLIETLNGDNIIPDLVDLLIRQYNYKIMNLTQKEPSLEDIFIMATSETEEVMAIAK